jgi:DNA polymerase III subunit beta
LGCGQLTLTKIEGETEVIIHTQEYGTFELPTTTEEYPESTDRNGEECFTIDSEQLSLAVKKTFYAASGDEYKQVLTGVRFSLGEVLELAATDGHKLALTISPIKISETLKELTVSAETLKHLSWALTKLPPGKIIIGIDEGSYISFTLGEFCLTGRLIAGDYPNYHQLFPSSFIRSLHVDRSSFLSALARVSLFHNNDRVIGIELVPEQKRLILSANSSDRGKGTATVMADIKGEALKIHFNSKYLADILRHLQGESILMQLNEATQPVVILDPIAPDENTKI